MVVRRKQQRLIRLIALNILLLGVAVFRYSNDRQQSVQVAVAKGKQMLDMPAAELSFPPGYILDRPALEMLALADEDFSRLLQDKEYSFLNAVPLSEGEARYWQDEGCGRRNCAHVTFYNYTDGGTAEAVVQLERREVIGRWADAWTRPGGSSEVLPRAMAIAAADPQVQSILGDIGAADPAMIPMSGWLADDDCREDWCVDLSFHDPAGTGRIFHVFVNMEQERVARTFYTRARADRSAARPVAQRNAFSDGCHEQYGWAVCWEMTAHDGVNFLDARYNGRDIFSSAKIGQIEAWYPSWPGGYRDEIGFSASVPPFGDTQVNDLGDGFEVRQLFTEFTHWPNCICCYRYEEIIRFNADGSFEPRFVSHGPGCDDLSIYRPFWRIDLDLDGPDNDQVWLWDQVQWVEGETEFETYPVVEDLSPEGHRLATFDEDVHYRWKMERTDPLGLDEAYLFLLAKNEMEGEGPILTGPGDTFIPPRQWIDGDALSGEDIVLWYVPLLNTKKGGPWWCMPDPEPDFSPCEAILRAEPAGELRQPTAEELAQLQAAPAAPTPTAVPTAPPAPTPTPRPLEGEDAETIILNAGCGACHAIGSLGEAHKVGPDLTYIGLDAAGRVPGMSAEEYIRQSILEPNAYLAPECPNGPCLPNVMPQNYATRMSDAQISTLVAYLLDRRGPAPTPAAIGQGVVPTIAAKVSPAAKLAAPAADIVSPTLAVQLLLVSLVVLISVFLLLRK